MITNTQDFGIGPEIAEPGNYTGVLDKALNEHLCPNRPLALEFGVGEGNSLRQIAEHRFVLGFDSFDGLPEDWRNGKFPKGTFACEPPEVPNSALKIGLFEATLQDIDFYRFIDVTALIHIDCDLYSSTVTVLNHIHMLFTPGVVVVFDEYHGYTGSEEHEEKAWREFIDNVNRDAKDSNGFFPEVHWEVIGHGPYQWAIKIIEAP